jgi:NADPH2:quinone reductase
MNVKAIRVEQPGPEHPGRLVNVPADEVGGGEVVIRVAYSGLNYKDALAVTGRGKILRRFPLIPGIDLAGEVIASDDPEFPVGARVLANGCGLGEEHDGGLAEVARLPAEWVMRLPEGLSLREAMILGTAGFTAALALHRMEVNGQHPHMGPVVVTGASGGVGSFATALLKHAGYSVVAVSGRKEQHARLRELGADEVATPESLPLHDAPLQKARYGGVIDNVGGDVLARLISAVQLWGNVASVGLAASPQWQATVFPFILRGVSLLGVSSANCPMILRRALWERLGDDWNLPHLETFVGREIGLEDVPDAAEKMLARQLHGRILVRVSPL